jgi:PIN domain
VTRPAAPPVFDTDVIYSRVLHELIGRLAYQERLLTLIWSDELLSEAERILVTRKQVPQQAAERWVNYMRQAFPDQRVETDHLPADLDLTTLTTDPGDHHICALAVAADTCTNFASRTIKLSADASRELAAQLKRSMSLALISMRCRARLLTPVPEYAYAP